MRGPGAHLLGISDGEVGEVGRAPLGEAPQGMIGGRACSQGWPLYGATAWPGKMRVRMRVRACVPVWMCVLLVRAFSFVCVFLCVCACVVYGQVGARGCCVGITGYLWVAICGYLWASVPEGVVGV